ncbi:MAG: oligosaccharide flippase family protein [Bacteroidales bacterium]|nr:oligosaccharide flippase family protein [Bacteroidales bacterium]
MSTKKNIIFNGIASVGSKGVRVAEQLLLVPFFLSAWGAAYYGEWLTLAIIPSVLAFSDLGLGTAASNSFVLAYTGGDKQKAAVVFKTGLTIVSWAVLFGIVLSFFVMILAYYGGFLNKSLIPPSDAIASLVFMMGSKLVNFYNQIFEAFYRAKERAASAINIGTLESLTCIIVGIFVLQKGGGVVAYASSIMVVSFVYKIVYAIVGLKLIGVMDKASFSKELAKDILKKGFGFLLSPIWQAIYFQGSTFVVRLALGAEAVAVFNTVRTLCRSVNQIYNLINQSVFPEFQIAVGAKDIHKAKKMFNNSMKIVLVAAFFGVVFLCLVGPRVYAWWTKDQLVVSDNVWCVFMIGVLFNAVWWTSEIVYRAMNKPYRFTICGTVSACISTLVSYYLSCEMGMIGATIGYVVLDILMVFLVVPKAFGLLGINVIRRL